jgi:hypothetical protein
VVHCALRLTPPSLAARPSDQAMSLFRSARSGPVLAQDSPFRLVRLAFSRRPPFGEDALEELVPALAR